MKEGYAPVLVLALAVAVTAFTLTFASPFGAALAEPEMVVHVPPHAILVTYCGKIPVGVILTTDPPTFVPYEEMGTNPAVNAAIPADRISQFDVCKASDVKTDV